MQRSGNSKRRRNTPKGGYRPRDERSDKRRPAQKSSESSKPQRPRDTRAIETLLSGIGKPDPTPFVPDPFQLEALEAIELEDVLVTAPTGSGKTWIAREEIRRLLAAGKRSWYTTPLKALTNSKYTEFIDVFGAENVGILTGDRKENSSAPIIVGTTEIYRNMIFDSMRGGEDVSADLVVLDEAHYLADEDRGHVWEESIILSPKRIRMLLLSATIGGAEDLADWIETVRGSTVRLITAGERPVELRAAYLSSELHLYPLYGTDGKFNRDLQNIDKKKESGQRRGWR